MTDRYAIDNSFDGDLKRVITWQYDQAENLIAFLGVFKGFFADSTEDFWEGFRKAMDIANAEGSGSVSEFGLAVWGKLLGIPRPVVSYQAEGEAAAAQHPMSADFYRRLLVGRFRLANENASMDAYIRFCDYVFGEGKVTATDGYDMSLKFTWTGDAALTTDADREMKSAVESIPDVVFAFPAGVRSSDERDAFVFGFAEQVRPATTGQKVIDDQTTATKEYTYTKNGYTYSRTHTDFKIGNFNPDTPAPFAWDRFAR